MPHPQVPQRRLQSLYAITINRPFASASSIISFFNRSRAAPVEAYIDWIRHLYTFRHRSPDRLGQSEIRTWLLHFSTERKLSASSINLASPPRSNRGASDMSASMSTANPSPTFVGTGTFRLPMGGWRWAAYGLRREGRLARHAALEQARRLGLPARTLVCASGAKRCRRCALPPHSTYRAAASTAASSNREISQAVPSLPNISPSPLDLFRLGVRQALSFTDVSRRPLLPSRPSCE